MVWFWFTSGKDVWTTRRSQLYMRSDDLHVIADVHLFLADLYRMQLKVNESIRQLDLYREEIGNPKRR